MALSRRRFQAGTLSTSALAPNRCARTAVGTGEPSRRRVPPLTVPPFPVDTFVDDGTLVLAPRALPGLHRRQAVAA